MHTHAQTCMYTQSYHPSVCTHLCQQHIFNVQVYIYTHVYIHVYIYIYIYICMCIHIHTYVCTQLHLPSACAHVCQQRSNMMNMSTSPPLIRPHHDP